MTNGSLNVPVSVNFTFFILMKAQSDRNVDQKPISGDRRLDLEDDHCPIKTTRTNTGILEVAFMYCEVPLLYIVGKKKCRRARRCHFVVIATV